MFIYEFDVKTFDNFSNLYVVSFTISNIVQTFALNYIWNIMLKVPSYQYMLVNHSIPKLVLRLLL